MSWHEALFALAGTVAAVCFLADYLRGGSGTRNGTSRAIAISAGGITTLVLLLLVRALLDWPQWVVNDAMGLLAAVMFPVWQLRMRAVRAQQAARVAVEEE